MDTYGLNQGRRIFDCLNETIPPTEYTLRDAIDKIEAPEKKKLSFWSHLAAEYDPAAGPEVKRPGSTIHMLLDSDPRVARLTGRMRSERWLSSQPGVASSEVACYEIEVLISEEGLRRQCYYCHEFEETEQPRSIANQSQHNPKFAMRRYGSCGDDIYWCNSVR